MSGIIERVAFGALDAEQPEPRSEAEEAHLNAEALALAQRSMLAGWFPVRWRCVDHNLPDGRPSLVVVEEDTDERPAYRFVIVGDNAVGNRQVYVTAAVKPVSWLERATPVNRASDVGLWLRQQEGS